MRLSELYVSVQGEGPRVGKPTIFVRFGGCNLRCALWPCDTPHAIFPEQYRHEWEKVGAEDLVKRITQLAAKHGVENICFTGGEPFLQPKYDINAVISHLDDAGFEMEAFTNGTLAYARNALGKVNLVMDWKLPGSGEEWDNPERLLNIARLRSRDYDGHVVKFTIADGSDFARAKQIWEEYLQPQYNKRVLPVYAGVVWGKLENSQLVDWILEHSLPWKLNVQVHNHVWDRSQRAI